LTQIFSLGGALEGADKFDRETELWSADRRHPDQVVHQVKDEADFRGRETVTNDGYAQGLVDIYRDTIVGNQYRVNSQPNWEVLSRVYSPRFDEAWADEFTLAVEDKFNLISEASQCWLDEQRKLTLSGLVRLAVAGFVYTGEVIATAGWVRETGRPFNTTVQMIMPVRLCNPDGQADDDTLRRGVRRDSRGKAVGYYFRKGYPSLWPDPAQFRWELWPAQKPWGRRQVIHITDTIQPDQTRGISALVAVLKTMKMTKRFQEVTLQNAIIKASYAASIESDMPKEVVAAQLGQSPANMENLHALFINTAGAYLKAVQAYAAAGDSIAIDGSKIAHFFPGTKLTVHPLGGPGDVTQEYESSLLRHIASGLGISAEEFSSDFSRSNYSNARAAMLKTYKHLQARKRFVADRFADEVYALWLEEDLNAGGLPLPRGFDQKVFYQPYGKEAMTACDWIGSGRGQIDELKETQAAILRVKGGLSTREVEIAKAGADWRKLFRQLQRESQLAEQLGLTFDNNPQRDGSTSGQTVMQETSDA
jgi:lambda family phage portal protein